MEPITNRWRVTITFLDGSQRTVNCTGYEDHQHFLRFSDADGRDLDINPRAFQTIEWEQLNA